MAPAAIQLEYQMDCFVAALLAVTGKRKGLSFHTVCSGQGYVLAKAVSWLGAAGAEAGPPFEWLSFFGNAVSQSRATIPQTFNAGRVRRR